MTYVQQIGATEVWCIWQLMDNVYMYVHVRRLYTVQTTSNCLVISMQLIILHELKYWIPHLNAYKNLVLGTYMQIALSGVVACL